MADETLATVVHPLPHRGTSFTWIPYWIYDIIVKLKAEGGDWRDYKDAEHKVWFDTLKKAFADYGDVDFIESRNGYVHKLSDYVADAPEVTLTAKTAPAFKVGDADLAASDLFTVSPSDTPITLTVDGSGNASIVSGKVHAIKAGDVTVTGTAGDKTATVKLTITAAS